MSYKNDGHKDAIIEALVLKCQENKSLNNLCAEFVRQFFSTVSFDDLNDWNFDDLYGAAIHFWTLLEKREPNDTKIRIVNPDFEQHGWQTTHTVVEILCDDMPFLVDSLRIVVKRMNLALHLVIHMGGIHVQRNAAGEIIAILPRNADPIAGSSIEAPIWMEINKQTYSYILKKF